MNHTHYALRLPNGQYLGRRDPSLPVEPVGPGHAHIACGLLSAGLHLRHAKAVLGFTDAYIVQAPARERRTGHIIHHDFHGTPVAA